MQAVVRGIRSSRVLPVTHHHHHHNNFVPLPLAPQFTRTTMSVQPLRTLQQGESIQVSGSKNAVYCCTNHGSSYSCTCVAWKIQKGRTTSNRTCKHLRALLGESFEAERLASGPPINSGLLAATKEGGKGKRPYSTQASKKDASSIKNQKLDSKTCTSTVGEEKGGPTGGVGDKRVMQLLLAHKFQLEGKKSPIGYWISEKLDGVRAFWDGEGKIWSRTGGRFDAPPWFISLLPQGTTLDGELFHSRNNFRDAVSIVRSGGGKRWEELCFKIFDIPSLGHLPFEARQEAMLKLPQNEYIKVVKQVKCESFEQLILELKRVEGIEGEGLMLREAGSLYIGKRSSTLLKVKTFFDAEAKVIGYEAGKGKYLGMTGSLICEMESGESFSCGSGMTDQDRLTPPVIGSIISYRFQDLTAEGKPRFPTFVGERLDMERAKDAVV